MYTNAKARMNAAVTPAPIAAFEPGPRPPLPGVGGEGVFVDDVEVADPDAPGSVTLAELVDMVVTLDAVAATEVANVVDSAHVFTAPEVDVNVKLPLNIVVAASSLAPNGPDNQNQQRVGNCEMWSVSAEKSGIIHLEVPLWVTIRKLAGEQADLKAV
jgi:hypothetical protein